MKGDVGLNQPRRVRPVDRRLHLVQRLRQSLQLLVLAPRGGELGGERLQSLSHLQKLVDPVGVANRPLAPLGVKLLAIRGGPYEGPGSMPDLDEAECLEELHCFPHRASADPQLLTQVALAGQLLSGGEGAALDELDQPVDDSLLEWHGPQGLELDRIRGHFCRPVSCSGKTSA
jgi:hypothetical protein